jgi:DNA-directed RNA polymerase sigma subunit (sigma70/sigma32)
VPNKHAAQHEEDLVRLYLNDIGKHALLTKADEARLAQAIEAGRDARIKLAAATGVTVAGKRELRRLIRDGDEAAETFVKANLRLVVSTASRPGARGQPGADPRGREV